MNEAHFGYVTRTTAPLTPEQMVVLLKLGALYLDGPDVGNWREFSHFLLEGQMTYLHTAFESPHMIDVLTAELWITREDWSVDFYIPHGAQKRLLHHKLALRVFKDGKYEDSLPSNTHVTAHSFKTEVLYKRLIYP